VAAPSSSAPPREEQQQRRERRAAAVPPTPAPPLPPTAGGIAATAATLALIDGFNRRSGTDNAGWLRAYSRAHLPQEAALELQADEAARELAFSRNSRQRVQEGLAKVLPVEDPELRRAALQALLGRERQYAVLRSQAVAVRAAALRNFVDVQEVSPQGALWMLNPLVTQHTPDCIALSGRFWPWAVLAKIRPPRHGGCRCYLLAAADAIRRGLWNGVVPSEDEAWALLAQLLPEDDEH
jgi:hypothetical protein